jgi:hypothetical protein
MFFVRLVAKRDLPGDGTSSRRHASHVDVARTAILELRAGAIIGCDRETGVNRDVRNFYLLMMSGRIGRRLGLRWAGGSDSDVAEGERATELQRWLARIRR